MEKIPVSFSENYLVLSNEGLPAGVSSSFCKLCGCSLEQLLLEPYQPLLLPFQALVAELAPTYDCYKVKPALSLPSPLHNFTVELVVTPRLLFFLLIPPLPQLPVKTFNQAQLASLLHDLHNLFGVIIANRSLLSVKSDKKRRSELLPTLLQVNRSAEDLLLSSLKKPPRQTIFALSKLVQTSLTTLAPVLGKIKVQLAVAEQKVFLKDGGVSIARIITNLLLNSCNAIRKKDAAQGKITISLSLLQREELPPWLQDEQSDKRIETANCLYLHENNLGTDGASYLALTISDNGCGARLVNLPGLLGAQPPVASQHGFGLASVRALLAASGAWQLVSRLGRGTKVSCLVPLVVAFPQPNSTH